MTIKANLAKITKEINDICTKTGRDATKVHIVAVTKYVSMETTKAAIEAGVTHIGENRSDGMLEKWTAIGDACTWHYIGSLQSRKVKEVINQIDYLHSLDRLSLAKEVDKRIEAGRVIDCFVQVNVSGEESKSGVTPGELIPFIEKLKQYESIRIIGLMTMAPFYDDAEQTRPIFQQLRKLRDDVSARGYTHAPCTELSMGMSNDYKIALEEGATYIRVGSALVGRE